LDWLRFGVTGKIVGGKLKTTSDKESLQADWIPLDKLNTLELRAKDILKLIESYKNTKSLIPINFNTS
jgi:8-oxo-dGDP phosphatase